MGSDELVMNLRPTDKSKHLGSYSFCFKGKTKVEQMQDETLLYRKKFFSNDEEGLPPVSNYIKKFDHLRGASYQEANDIAGPIKLQDFMKVEDLKESKMVPKLSKKPTLG